MSLLEVLGTGKSLVLSGAIRTSFRSPRREGSSWRKIYASKIKLEDPLPNVMGKVPSNGNKKRCILSMADKEMRFSARVVSRCPLSGERTKTTGRQGHRSDVSKMAFAAGKKYQLGSSPWTKHGGAKKHKKRITTDKGQEEVFLCPLHRPLPQAAQLGPQRELLPGQVLLSRELEIRVRDHLPSLTGRCWKDPFGFPPTTDGWGRRPS